MAAMWVLWGRGERSPAGTAIQMMLGVVLLYMARRTIGALERDLLGVVGISAQMGLVSAWTGLKANSAVETAVLVQGVALLLAAALALIGRSGYKVLHEQFGRTFR